MDAPFRKELIEARPNQWLGAAHLATPLPLLWLTCLAAAFTTSIVLLLVFGHYTRRETIAGQLVPNTGILRAHSHAIGTVTRVFVHEGENVSRGDPLVEVSGERSSAALGSTGALIATELNAQEKRLSVQLANQESLARNQRSGLENRLGMLREQSEQIDGQITLGQQRVQSSSAMLAKLLPLRKDGYISAYQYAQQEAEVLQLQSQLKDLARQKLDTRQQISQTIQQINQTPLDLAERQTALQQSLSQNAQELAQNELQRDAVVRAPADGVVSTLLIKQGQTVGAEQPLLSILPKGSLLQAQLLVPSSAIGFVEPGDQVVMRYQAFPYQRFGQQYGRVLSVSRSALSNDEVTSLLGVGSQEPMYRVLVTLQDQSIDAFGKAEPLKAGMILSADIMLDRRTLWQWAFEPLYGLRQQLTGRNGE